MITLLHYMFIGMGVSFLCSKRINIILGGLRISGKTPDPEKKLYWMMFDCLFIFVISFLWPIVILVSIRNFLKSNQVW